MLLKGDQRENLMSTNPRSQLQQRNNDEATHRSIHGVDVRGNGIQSTDSIAQGGCRNVYQ